MNKAEDHLQSINSTLSSLVNKLDKKSKNLEEDKVSKKEYEQFIKNAKYDRAKQHNAYLQNLYSEYL